ncbi:MAG TPA: hypothetical protein VGJ20_10560 [Xanthobacteraceae bacterium]
MIEIFGVALRKRLMPFHWSEGHVRLPWISTGLAALVAAGVFLVALLTTTASHELDIVSSQIIWLDGLDVGALRCLTLSPRKLNNIYKADYSDDPKVLDIARQHFPKAETVLTDDPNCPFVLSFNVIVTDTRAVQLGGRISRLLMSISVIERHIGTDSLYYEGQSFKGVYKNLYLFTTDLAPLEALQVGLRAFVTPQTKEWEVMHIETSAP